MLPIRIAVVDGDTLSHLGMSWLAAQNPDVDIVAEAETAADGLRVVAAHRPDVVTVEVILPDGDGLRLARQLRDRYPDLGIVVLSTRDEDDVLFQALDTGMSAFVSKSAPSEEILGAIRHAAVAAR